MSNIQNAAPHGAVLNQLAQWAANLTLGAVPADVVEEAKNQVLSTLAAVHSGYASDLGPALLEAFPPPPSKQALVLPCGSTSTAAHAAFLMAAWSMVLDFDDVMLGGHTGHSSVLVPLAYALRRQASGADLVVAQIVANEIAARVNMTVALGQIRGQMAAHLHLLGAAAARAKIERAPTAEFSQALAFALSFPGKALYPAFLGSDAKSLSAAWPLRMGLEALDATRAGLQGNARIVEDERGFLATFTQIPRPEFLGGLGTHWHTSTNSYKIYPVCGYLCGVIDAVLTLVRRHRIVPDDLATVDVYGSIFTVGMDAHSAPYLDGARSRIATLTFCTPYTVACAIRDQALTPAHFARATIRDERIWQLAAKVKVHHDVDRTIAALVCDIPVGAALKRARRSQAIRFVLGLGGRRFTRRLWRENPLGMARLLYSVARIAGIQAPPVMDDTVKALGARVRMRTRAGEEFEAECEIPLGFAGRGDWRERRVLMREKYLACATPTVGIHNATAAVALLDRLEQLTPEEVGLFLRLNAVRRTARRRPVEQPM